MTYEGSFSDEAASKEIRANLSSSTIPTVFKQYTAAHCTIATLGVSLGLLGRGNLRCLRRTEMIAHGPSTM